MWFMINLNSVDVSSVRECHMYEDEEDHSLVVIKYENGHTDEVLCLTRIAEDFYKRVNVETNDKKKG